MPTRRHLPSLIILTLLIINSLFLRTSTVIAAPFTWTDITVDKMYDIRGGSFTVTASSNSSTVRVQVFDPSDTRIYNQLWDSNTSRTLPISPTAAYGTYRVLAITTTSTTTTLFTVLNISGWGQVTTFPYEVTHNNLKYTFYNNWTLTAENGGNLLDIDMGVLRTLTNMYNLEVSATRNDMNFRVHFSGDGVSIDLVFAFIHSGLKMVVEGTIPQARDFTFKVNRANVKSMLDGIRNGSLVFDWSDMRKAGNAFSYNAATKTLTVSIPQSFRIDPVIFSNGFEEGNFSAWTSTTGTPTVSTTQKHHDTYAEYINNNWEFATKTYASPVTEYYTRCYVYLTGSLATTQFAPFMGDSSTRSRVRIINTGGTYYWQLAWTNSAWGTSTKSSTVSLSQNTWYCAEVWWKANTANGTTLKIDGTLVITANANTCDGVTTIIRMGATEGTTTTYYLDCVVTDDEAIGVESTISEYSRAASKALSLAIDSEPLRELSRAAAKALTLSIDSTTLYEFARAATKALTFAIDSAPLYEFARAATNTLTMALSATPLRELSRVVSQALSLAIDSTPLRELVRAVTQAITFTLDASKGLVTEIAASLSLTLSSSAAKVLEFAKVVTQTITVAVNAGLLRELIKSVTQAITFTLDAATGLVTEAAVSLSLTITSSTTKALELLRSTTQSLTITLNATPLREITRTVTQAFIFTLNSAKQRLVDVATSVTITVISSTVKAMEFTRTATQIITATINAIATGMTLIYTRTASLVIEFVARYSTTFTPGSSSGGGWTFTLLLIPLFLFFALIVGRRR